MVEERVIAQDRAPESLLLATTDLNTTSSNEHAILNNQRSLWMTKLTEKQRL